MYTRIRMTLFGVLVLMLSACSFNFNPGDNRSPGSGLLPFAVDTEVTVTGTITGTIDDCAFDGICAFVLDVNGETINAIWTEGMLPCQGQSAAQPDLGTQIEVFGRTRDANSLSICPSAAYYIRTIGG